MYSQKTRYWRHQFMVPLLGALLGQAAIAADTTPPFPHHAPSLPLLAAAPASRPIVDDEECDDLSVALPLATSPLAASPADPIRLAVSPRMSSPDVRPPPAATPFTTPPAEPALTLRKEGPLVWQAAAATPVEPAPARPAAALSTWDIAVTDVSLNAVLTRWAAIAGWQLVWELPVDYAVESRLTLSGTFEEAVEAVAHSMASVEEPMQAIFYKKNRVVRIVAKGAR